MSNFLFLLQMLEPIDPKLEVISGTHPISLITGKPIPYYPGTGDETLLGEGTYGEVYEYPIPQGPLGAGSSQQDAPAYAGPVAVKIGFNENNTISADIIRESASVINLHHPNVIPLLDAFLLNGAMSLVYPLAQGSIGSLKYDRLTTKGVFFQIVRGVAYLHSKDIYHGDLKPANILWDRVNGKIVPKIADFGLARTARCFVKDKELVAMTIWWRPPELLLGGKYGDTTDVWTLGCICYDLMADRPLFRGMNERAMIEVIASKLGPIDEKTWSGVTLLPGWKEEYSKLPHSGGNPFNPITDPETLRIMSLMLQLDPQKRISLVDLLADPYFDDVRNTVIPAPPLTSLDCSVALLNNIMPSSKGSQMSLRQQRTLYEWMMEVQQGEWHCSDRVVATAIALYERYATAQKLTHEKWQGYATTALMLATFMEPDPQEAANVSFITDYSYDAKEVLQMERDLLTVCGLNLFAATGYDIMKVFLDNYSEMVKDASSTLYQLHYFTTLSGKYGHKEIAMICIEMGCRFAKVPFGGESNPDAIRTFRYDLSSILDVEREPIYDLVKRGSIKTVAIVRQLGIGEP